MISTKNQSQNTDLSPVFTLVSILLIFRWTSTTDMNWVAFHGSPLSEGTVLVPGKPASHQVSPSTSVVNLESCPDLHIIFCVYLVGLQFHLAPLDSAALSAALSLIRCLLLSFKDQLLSLHVHFASKGHFRFLFLRCLTCTESKYQAFVSEGRANRGALRKQYCVLKPSIILFNKRIHGSQQGGGLEDTVGWSLGGRAANQRERHIAAVLSPRNNNGNTLQITQQAHQKAAEATVWWNNGKKKINFIASFLCTTQQILKSRHIVVCLSTSNPPVSLLDFLWALW